MIEILFWAVAIALLVAAGGLLLAAILLALCATDRDWGGR